MNEIHPDIVTMENVPRLAEQTVFEDFVYFLKESGFFVYFSIVNCADYGVPQQRNRLVLLASRFGEIDLIPPTTPEGQRITVRNAIGDMPPLGAGDICSNDPLHQTAAMSPLNLKRIRVSTPGGSWKEWEQNLVAACHQKQSGKTYPSVYGRMQWDESSPTITTQYYGFGNGRFGHPVQDRALSLREGAILQSFPKDYVFVSPQDKIRKKTVGRMIGNAVPVKLGEAIGISVKNHLVRMEDRQNDTLQ